MRSFIAAFIVLVIVYISFACKKNGEADESDLYGTWVKGSNLGDTLWFMKKDGKFIMRQPESFNPQMPMYSEKEYKFKDGELSVKLFAPYSQDYSPITSFSWTDRRKEFSLQNIQLFMFMSSIVTYKYKKL